MDFWDHLTFATTLAIRDYYREKEKQKKKLEEFRMQCGSEIAAEASKFYNLAQKLTEQAKIRIVPKEFTDGTMLFPMYVFNRVLALQRNRVTKSQDKLLSTYRATMMAVVKPSPTMSAVNEIMRIDDTGVGAFWKIFFKVLYLTPNDEHVLIEISECFTNVAVRFAFLGGVDIKLTEPMCNAFIRALHIQSIACRSLPEEDIDFIGEIHFLEHKDRMYSHVHS